MKALSGFIVFFFFLLFHLQTPMAQMESIGFIKSVSGEVHLVGDKSSVQAYPNMKVLEGDTLKTGVASSVGLIFEDDTVVSLGPESEMVVDDFLFNPIEGELSFVARMIKGTFSFITGQIAKLAPQKVIFETPDATLGVRGTKFAVKIQ